MKKQNKRLSALAILSVLVLGGATKTAAALALNQPNLLNGGLDVASTLAFSATETPIWDINKDEGAMDALDINGSDSSFSFVLMAPNGWRLETFELVYRNYEQGITERVADEAARTLGEQDSSAWAIRIAKKDYPEDFTAGRFAQVGFPSKTFLSDNLTNELYYALKLVDQSNPAEYTWKRGKLSYRRCAKTEGFDDATMQCQMAVVDGYHTPKLKKAYNYGNKYLDMIPEDQIEDWGTEWRRVLTERHNRLAELLDNSDLYVRNFISNMNNVETLLTQLDKTQNSVSGLEEIANDLGNRRTQLQSLRDYYASLRGDSAAGEELENLREQNQNLISQNNNLTSERDNLISEKNNLASEKANLIAEKTNLTNQVATLEQEKRDLSTQVEQLQKEIEELKGAGSADSEWQEKVAILETEKNALVESNRTLENRNNALESENQTLKSAKQTLEDEKVTLETEKKSLLERTDELAGQLAEEKRLKEEWQNRANSNEKCVANNTLATGNEPSNLGSSNSGPTANGALNGGNETTVSDTEAVTTVLSSVDSSVGENTDKTNAADAQEIEVPRLGGHGLNVWLGIALLALALGTLLLWIKRTMTR